MAESDRRRQLNQRLRGLHWKLVLGSGTAFFGFWFLIAAQTAAAANPADSQPAPVPEDAAQADPVTQPRPPQVGNAVPSYPPLVRTRRS